LELALKEDDNMSHYSLKDNLSEI